MSWEERLKQLITPEANKFPYRIVQVKPNKKVDQEIYALSGREEAIAANGSLFLALYDLAQRDRIDFDEWFEQWSLGFPQLDVNREQSNYPLLGQNQWRKTEERPKFKDWTPRELRHKLGYRTIEVWLNRNVESESTVFSGTDMQLINHCIQLEYEGGGSSASTNSIPGKNSRPPLKGWPLITLSFLQSNKDRKVRASGKLARLTTGEKYIRCAGYTDNRQIAEFGFAQLITSSDIRRWSNKIVDLFAKPPYAWEKGKKSLSYYGHLARLQGLEGYALVNSAAQGKELFTRILKIFDYSPDPAGFKYSGNEAEEIAYPENPSDFQLLGKQWEADIERPRDSVIFSSATLTLPLLGNSIPLVYGDRVVYDA
jgi:hypothetical protein